MALDINNIKQASPKANQVATEQYVDTSIATIDVTQDISANNDIFAQSQGFANYNDMVAKYTALKKTIISSGYINTGLVRADSIVVNSLSADRLVAGTNSSTVWTGGGLVSQNFNGNVHGAIGSPTQGFRLSSNAAGTSADPNIYGAYIKGATIEGLSLDVGDIKVKADGFPSNTGDIFSSFSGVSAIMGGYGNGHSKYRICSKSGSIVSVKGSVKYSLALRGGRGQSVSSNIQYRANGGAWVVLENKTASISANTGLSFDITTSGTFSFDINLDLNSFGFFDYLDFIITTNLGTASAVTVVIMNN